MAAASSSSLDVLFLCAMSAVTVATAGCDLAPPQTSAGQGSPGITTSPFPDGDTDAASGGASDPGEDAGGAEGDGGTPVEGSSSSSGDVEPQIDPGAFPDLGGGVPDLDPRGPLCPEARAQIMLVLDKSASMELQRWDHDLDETTSRVTRWETLYEAVGGAAELLDGVADVGVLLFPAVGAERGGSAAEACVVKPNPELSLGPNTAEEIVDALPAFDVDGGTPTTDAMLTAVAQLEVADPRRPRAIVLVTDGAANCGEGDEGWLRSYDPRAIDVVADAWELGIPTFVVGVDILDEPDAFSGKNVRDAINELAEVGGMPAPGADAFYNVRDGLALTEALEGISGEILCPTPEG